MGLEVSSIGCLVTCAHCWCHGREVHRCGSRVQLRRLCPRNRIRDFTTWDFWQRRYSVLSQRPYSTVRLFIEGWTEGSSVLAAHRLLCRRLKEVCPEAHHAYRRIRDCRSVIRLARSRSGSLVSRLGHFGHSRKCFAFNNNRTDLNAK